MFEEEIDDKEESASALEGREEYFGGGRVMDGRIAVFFPRWKQFVPCDGLYGRRGFDERADWKECD